MQNETISSSVAQTPQVASFATQLSPSPSSTTSSMRPTNRDPSRLCTACGRSGHEASSCWKVVGYPEWYGRGRGSTGCGRRNSGPTPTPRANTTQIIGASTASQPTTVNLTDADRQGLSGVTEDQWKIIQRIVGSTPKPDTLSGKNNVVWILDMQHII